MVTSRLVHPLLMRSLPDVFARLARIANRTVVSDPYGQEIETYIPDAQLGPIPCMKDPVTGRETRRADGTIVVQPFEIALQGYYPTITEADVIHIDETDYNVLAVKHDDTRTITIVTAEIVNLPPDKRIDW